MALQLACLQRLFLEVYARWQWLEKWIPRLKDVDAFYDTDPNIMGAFTEYLDDAADLFRIGIPLWLVHPLQQQPATRIDQFVLPLDENVSKLLPLRGSNLHLDVSDEVPPHPVIYRGLPGRFKRYRCMTIFLQRHFRVSVLGSFDPCDLPSAAGCSNILSSTSAQIQVNNIVDIVKRDWVTAPPAKKKQKTSSCHSLP